MAINEELQSFVKEALTQGTPRNAVKDTLLEAGWRADQVESALSAYAPTDFPIPVPVPKPYLSAREAFIYLVLFTTLYLTTFNLGRLIFQFINIGLPDPAAYYDYVNSARQAIRFSVASLIIAFPIFMYLSVLIGRSIKRDPSKRASKVRKWLTYMTLFVAAAVIIGDLTALVYNFLGGELSLRFALKVITVAAIAGGIFGYYLWDLRQEER
ncbi:hypothetical protein KAR02_03240, partial [Candidatus Bipolaricaulota bacterium]|nr:hypothetical protein [Candidatus Bipolaricaulota bacterium]